MHTLTSYKIWNFYWEILQAFTRKEIRICKVGERKSFSAFW